MSFPLGDNNKLRRDIVSSTSSVNNLFHSLYRDYIKEWPADKIKATKISQPRWSTTTTCLLLLSSSSPVHQSFVTPPPVPYRLRTLALQQKHEPSTFSGSSSELHFPFVLLLFPTNGHSQFVAQLRTVKWHKPVQRTTTFAVAQTLSKVVIRLSIRHRQTIGNFVLRTRTNGRGSNSFHSQVLLLVYL